MYNRFRIKLPTHTAFGVLSNGDTFETLQNSPSVAALRKFYKPGTLYRGATIQTIKIRTLKK